MLNYQRYLAAMGIEVWLLRETAKPSLPENLYQRYDVVTAVGKIVGSLYLQKWEKSVYPDEQIYQLLEAMFAGIACKCRVLKEEAELENRATNLLIIMKLNNKFDQVVKQLIHSQQSKLRLIEIDHPIILLDEPARKRNAWIQLKKLRASDVD